MSTLLRRGVPGATVAAHVHRRATGSFAVDEWGLDPEMVSLANPIFGLRWDIEVQGADQLPALGGAVLVFNRRFGVSEPWVVARGIRQATGRFVRTVGVPDVAPIGPFLRRFGGVLDRTDEIAGLLRSGQLVGLPMSRDLRSRERVGSLDVERLEAAIETGCPVVPVALVGPRARPHLAHRGGRTRAAGGRRRPAGGRRVGRVHPCRRPDPPRRVPPHELVVLMPSSSLRMGRGSRMRSMGGEMASRC